MSLMLEEIAEQPSVLERTIAAELEKSIQGILNPQPMTEEMAKALDASPAGPWSNVMRP